MGCSPSAIVKKMVKSAIDKVDEQLKTAEGQLQKQLDDVVGQVDKPIDDAIGGVETQVDSQTKEIVSPLKGALKTAVGQSTAPVQGVIGGFKDKTNFDTSQIQQVIKTPLDTVHSQINESKEKLKATVGDLCRKQADKIDISVLELEGNEIGFKARNKLKTEVTNIVDPQLQPVLATTDQSIQKAKEGINTGFGPILAPVDSVETQLNSALNQAEAPINAIKAQANGQLEGLMGNLAGMVKQPLQAAAAAAKQIVNKPLEAAEQSFVAAEDAAVNAGRETISKVSVPEVQAVGLEQLNAISSESKSRGKKMVDDTRSKITSKIYKCENEQDFAVEKLKKVPTRSMDEVFGDVMQPINDIKKPVTEPISNVKKTVEDTRGTAFTELDNCKKEIVDFKGELIDFGVNEMIEALVASKGVKKGS